MDVDGVLTDGTVWLDEDGHETKRISFADVMGSRWAGAPGYSSRWSRARADLPRPIAAKLGISDVYRGCKDKAAAVRDFAPVTSSASTRCASWAMT